jgi:hypothetical protein
MGVLYMMGRIQNEGAGVTEHRTRRRRGLVERRRRRARCARVK